MSTATKSSGETKKSVERTCSDKVKSSLHIRASAEVLKFL